MLVVEGRLDVREKIFIVSRQCLYMPDINVVKVSSAVARLVYFLWYCCRKVWLVLILGQFLDMLVHIHTLETVLNKSEKRRVLL